MIDGMGPDAATVVNESGGKQSYLPYRMDLEPPLASFAKSEVLDQGARKYGEENWRGIGWRDHLNHCLCHIRAFLAGDRSDRHIAHAAVRLDMSLELLIKEGLS